MTYSILTSYADDNTLHIISSIIETVLSFLRTDDAEHAINWFIENFINIHSKIMEVLYGIYCLIKLSQA